MVVEAVLLANLKEILPHVPGEEPLPWRLELTTFYHVHEVERGMAPHGIETFALLTRRP